MNHKLDQKEILLLFLILRNIAAAYYKQLQTNAIYAFTVNIILLKK